MGSTDRMQPSRLCQEFARILNSTPAVINGVCTATRSGRIFVQLFWDAEQNHLCLSRRPFHLRG